MNTKIACKKPIATAKVLVIREPTALKFLFDYKYIKKVPENVCFLLEQLVFEHTLVQSQIRHAP
jgi:hypothetical protein